MDIQIDARGKQCPLPVIEAKQTLGEMRETGTVTVLADNEIAVQNIMKMARHRGYTCGSKTAGKDGFEVWIAVEEENLAHGGQGARPDENAGGKTPLGAAEGLEYPRQKADAEAFRAQGCGGSGDTLLAISSNCMGGGDERLGRTLLKGYLYAVSKLEPEDLPQTILMYNTGAYLPLADSESLEDLKAIEALGVEILTCGTCLDYYGLKEKLAVGGVTNMYTIAEKLAKARKIIKP